MRNRKRLALLVFLSSFFYPLTKIIAFDPLLTIAYSILAVAIVALVRFDDARSPWRRFLPWSVAPVLLISVYIVIVTFFGAFDFGAVVYHLQSGTRGGSPDVPVDKVIWLVLSFASFVGPLWYLRRHDRRFLYMDATLAVALLAVNPVFYSAADYYLSPADATLTEFYRNPPAHFPPGARRKNLLVIYAESAERTFGEIAGGDKAYAEMAEIAGRGLDVHGIGQAANTGWSMAGFVASQCGVPLQPRGLFRSNNFSGQSDFFQGATCLSDVLSANGYHAEFMNGSFATFAGLATFLDDHGFRAHSGLDEYRDVAGEYLNNWGLYDDTLLEMAERRVAALHGQPEPFVFSVATIGGHSPNGHATRTCEKELDGGGLSRMQFAIKCQGHHIRQFLRRLEDRNLLADTVVVVLSDHLIMKNEHSEELGRRQRTDFLSISGDGIAPAVVARQGAMFDVFPTLLQVLGMDVPQGRAGIGVSLLSPEKNLVERYGLEKLNRMISHDWMLSRKLWGDDQAPAVQTAGAGSRTG